MRVARLMPIAVLAVAAGGAAVASAQAPARETVTALLNGKKVTVDYGRPARKAGIGRERERRAPFLARLGFGLRDGYFPGVMSAVQL